ncbi:ImmA/IrrE family metallo-endopeptidase [Thomasclavelia spiroformis]|uniref:ImmA/IrrE family metallo-endopeptidase n=1 Tax=Thomasclavelia spiroformis TaxID=29348 RepID=UPI001CD6FE83|nr:ImmA/IrrE family metallo-endopeptidase [Thomasclavelia spiroformis]
MCPPLERIRGKKAEEILKEYGEYEKVPVDIMKILKKIGAFVIEDDLSFLEDDEDIKKNIEKYGELCGVILATKRNLGVFFKKLDVDYKNIEKVNSAKHRSRFTLAHELAHCALHTDNIGDGYVEYRFENGMTNINDAYSHREEEANIYAGELLIPEHSLNEMINKLEVPSINALSKIFDVSGNVMKARMEYLGREYLNDIPGKEC